MVYGQPQKQIVKFKTTDSSTMLKLSFQFHYDCYKDQTLDIMPAN